MTQEFSKLCRLMAENLVGRPGSDVWPSPLFHPAEGNHFVHREFIRKFSQYMSALLKSGYDIPRIARVLGYPARLVRYMYLFLNEAESQVERQQRIESAEYIVQLLSSMRPADPFCESGSSILWDDRTVQETILWLGNETAFMNSDSSKLLAELAVLGWSYCEFCYFCHHVFGMEIHGPYSLDTGGKLLVRDYHGLKPAFWNFVRHFPYPRVVIYAVYDSDIDVVIDVAGRTKYRSDLASQLKKFAVVCYEEGGLPNFIDIVSISSLLESFRHAINTATEEVLDLSKRELIKKYITVFFYSLKPLAEELGENWQLDAELYAQVDTTESNGTVAAQIRKLSSLPKDEQIRILCRLFDPRR